MDVHALLIFYCVRLIHLDMLISATLFFNMFLIAQYLTQKMELPNNFSLQLAGYCMVKLFSVLTVLLGSYG